MEINIYSTAWNIKKMNFDYKDALDNWSLYADNIVIAVNNCDETYELLETYAKEKQYKVTLIRTSFDPKKDPYYYGKVENAALQSCSGSLMIQQNLDERLLVDKQWLYLLPNYLQNSGAKALFVPTIDLYGSREHYVNIGRKWYIHLPGLYRGPVYFGIKSNGLPDYNKTSSDELIDNGGNLVPTISMIEDLSIESLREYVSKGLPLVYHLGFLDLNDRATRAVWWKDFWQRATGGDENNHITDVNELLKRETKKHNLPLWKTQK